MNDICSPADHKHSIKCTKSDFFIFFIFNGEIGIKRAHNQNIFILFRLFLYKRRNLVDIINKISPKVTKNLISEERLYQFQKSESYCDFLGCMRITGLSLIVVQNFII